MYYEFLSIINEKNIEMITCFFSIKKFKNVELLCY